MPTGQCRFGAGKWRTAGKTAVSRQRRGMHAADNGVTSGINKAALFYGIRAPEQKNHPVTFGTDGGNDRIGEFFPAETPVTAGGTLIDGQKRIKQ